MTLTPTRRTTAQKTAEANPDDAVVIEEHKKTTTYKKKKPEDEKTTTGTTNNNTQGANQTKTAAFVFDSKANIPTNKLAQMFQELADVEDEQGEVFYALVTRRADLMTDTFRKPCMSNTNFPPMQISSQMMLQFIPLIQKYNGNSGGRFDVVICDSNGENLEIGMSAYAIPDPPYEEIKLDGNNNTGGVGELIGLMREELKANREVMVKLLEGKEDEFTKLAKEKLRNDILNPPQATNTFDPSAVMQQVMTSVAVTQSMAEGFAKMFGSNNLSDKDKGLLESLLTNEMFMSKAQEVYEHSTSIIGDLVLARTNPEMFKQQQAERATGFAAGDPYPPLQEQTQSEADEQTMADRLAVMMRIIEELESERVLDDTNPVLQELKEQYTDIYEQVVQSCKQMPFEMLFPVILMLIPEDIKVQYYDGDALNEKGTYVSDRLQQFAEYLKTK